MTNMMDKYDGQTCTYDRLLRIQIQIQIQIKNTNINMKLGLMDKPVPVEDC